MHWPIVILLTGTFSNFSVTWYDKSVKYNIEHGQYWQKFKATHNKQYDSLKEETTRKTVFYGNLKKIYKHNERFKQGLETFEMGINHFSDMTTSEFEETYFGSNTNETIGDSYPEMKTSNTTSNVRVIKWFTHVVNWYQPAIPVRDQGSCNACWAFAATALLEYEFYSRRKIVTLSAQELVDCTGSQYGCRGGWTKKALQFVKNRGINYERDYPYVMEKSRICKLKKEYIAPKIIRKVKNLKQTEKAMYEELRSRPLKIAIYANPVTFQHYKNGYITPETCEQKRPNHAVVLLGAIKENNVPLWFIRNSFGSDWGYKGHAKLLMNQNTCNLLARAPVYIIT